MSSLLIFSVPESEERLIGLPPADPKPLPEDLLDRFDVSDSGEDSFFSSHAFSNDFVGVDDDSDIRDREFSSGSNFGVVNGTRGGAEATNALAPPKLNALTSSSC